MKTVMNTYNHKIFDPMEMTCEDVDILDIAHALSMLCRGCGHVQFFYSVGLHSINCALEAQARNYPPKIQLACLLHDASEAYISDIIRPVKQHLPKYQEIEHNILSTIFQAFGLELSFIEQKMIKEIDDQMLANEMPIIFSTHNLDSIPPLQSQPTIKELPFAEVKQRFLALFATLNEKNDRSC
ncbi:MAG: phosphohydrolase [Erysipelotrichaceae bacterium]|nr:phosphohydrolase [Erysipelotrichaceae bacterium]MDY5252109.1 phosphohydrolase [Erysipelotrichaceae bacterium]